MAPPEIQEATVADDGKAANLTFQVGPSSLEQRKVIVDDIRVQVSPGGALAAAPGHHRHPRRASPSSASACSRTSPTTGPC